MSQEGSGANLGRVIHIFSFNSSQNSAFSDGLALTYHSSTSSDIITPYWIGARERKGVGQYINPEAKSATLRSNPTGADSSEFVWYKDSSIDGDRGDNSLNKKWEVVIKPARLDIFRVSGGLDEELGVERIIKAKVQARYALEATKPKIKSEELSKRIEGFGSAG